MSVVPCRTRRVASTSAIAAITADIAAMPSPATSPRKTPTFFGCLNYLTFIKQIRSPAGGHVDHHTPKYFEIPFAASRPSKTAVTTRSEPRTMSPPANTLGLVVWNG